MEKVVGKWKILGEDSCLFFVGCGGWERAARWLDFELDAWRSCWDGLVLLEMLILTKSYEWSGKMTAELLRNINWRKSQNTCRVGECLQNGWLRVQAIFDIGSLEDDYSIGKT